MTAPIHPALEQADRARELAELNSRMRETELKAEGRPALRRVVDRLAEIDRQFMTSNVQGGFSSPSRAPRPDSDPGGAN